MITILFLSSLDYALEDNFDVVRVSLIHLHRVGGYGILSVWEGLQ